MNLRFQIVLVFPHVPWGRPALNWVRLLSLSPSNPRTKTTPNTPRSSFLSPTSIQTKSNLIIPAKQTRKSRIRSNPREGSIIFRDPQVRAINSPNRIDGASSRSKHDGLHARLRKSRRFVLLPATSRTRKSLLYPEKKNIVPRAEKYPRRLQSERTANFSKRHTQNDVASSINN